MSLHHEINFEKEICQYLGSNGWLYTEGDATGYDRARAVFPADLVDWVQEKDQGEKPSQVFMPGSDPSARETISLNQF
jgi:hypothetical protein